MRLIDRPEIVIRPAQSTDLPAILHLLAENKLPPDGLAAHLGTALVAYQADQCVGSSALELYGNAALLRSVAVTPRLQRHGLGQRLVGGALMLARKQAVAEVYLLTETASDFFHRLGFSASSREEVPIAVQQSVEFTSACPQSALVMSYRLFAEKSGIQYR